MLTLPAGLDAGSFLAQYWQKKPLFMAGAIGRLRPAVSRNELAWLATHDDVESRIVFTERDGDRVRYSAETGPFDEDYLASLPKRLHDLLEEAPLIVEDEPSAAILDELGIEHTDEHGARRTDGPRINELTDSAYRDPLAGTPYHKHVRVRLRPLAENELRSGSSSASSTQRQ